MFLFPLQPHTPEHFLEVKLESYNTRFFHIKEDFAYTEVQTLSVFEFYKENQLSFTS